MGSLTAAAVSGYVRGDGLFRDLPRFADIVQAEKQQGAVLIQPDERGCRKGIGFLRLDQMVQLVFCPHQTGEPAVKPVVAEHGLAGVEVLNIDFLSPDLVDDIFHRHIGGPAGRIGVAHLDFRERVLIMGAVVQAVVGMLGQIVQKLPVGCLYLFIGP